jgi:hypothetical protein
MKTKTTVLALALLAPVILPTPAPAQALTPQQQQQLLQYQQSQHPPYWQPPPPIQSQRPGMSASPGAYMGAPGWNQAPPQPTPRPPFAPYNGPSPGNFVGPTGVHPPSAVDVFQWTAKPAGETTTMPGYTPQGR